ncbi:MAG TPA: hypothetical protein EYQ54_18560 [Myxococcales bacterium]|nr:hypothetical protein [Myxococcales bacterium]
MIASRRDHGFFVYGGLERDFTRGIPTVQAIFDSAADYALTRGNVFTSDERSAIFGMAVYTIAYGARCLNFLTSVPVQPEQWPGNSWPGLLRDAVDPLLAQ